VVEVVVEGVCHLSAHHQPPHPPGEYVRLKPLQR